MQGQDERETPKTGGIPRWVLFIGSAVVLLLCSCTATVFLVLTGIIAEPETVIEQFLRAVTGS